MVSDVLTHPTQMGNRQRIHRECVQMKQLGWEVDFLYFENNIGNDVDMTRDFFGDDHFFQCFKGNYTIKTQVKRQIREYLDQKGVSRYVALKYSADEWYTNEIEDVVRNLLIDKNYDAIWVQYLFQSKVLECLSDIPILKVIDTHDRWANRNRIFQKVGRTPSFFYTTIKEEKRALKRADLVIAIQERESKYFRKLLKDTSTKVLTLGDFVEKKKVAKGKDFTYGFIGANNEPNIIGIEWFCTKILPIVLKKCPNSQLVIAGGVCDCIPDYEGVYKMGRVETLDDFYSTIKLVINPVQNGTGLNIKTIEALAYGKPLVTTTVGAKGIKGENDILIKCDKPQDFADEIVHLLTNEKICDELVENAHLYINKYNESNIQTLCGIEKFVMDRG